MRQKLRVKELAQERGLSMGKLERMADISHPTLRDIYRNPFKEVKSSTLQKIAQALNVTLDALYEWVSDEESKE